MGIKVGHSAKLEEDFETGRGFFSFFVVPVPGLGRVSMMTGRRLGLFGYPFKITNKKGGGRKAHVRHYTGCRVALFSCI